MASVAVMIPASDFQSRANPVTDEKNDKRTDWQCAVRPVAESAGQP